MIEYELLEMRSMFMNIVVLAGGLSTERDVSLITGSMVSRALREKGHRVIMLDVFMGYQEAETDISDIFDHCQEASVPEGVITAKEPDLAKVKAMRKDQSDCFFGPNVIAICRVADFVFMALHGENGENGKIQAAFDLFGIRYTGTGYLGSALAMDKGISKKMFDAAGIPTPHWISMKKNEQKTLAETGLGLPCVVKPCCGGSSIGVFIARTEEEYEKALRDAFRYEDEIVVEDYVEGREFSVGVIDYRALPVIEIAPVEGFYDYQNKYTAGATIETCPAELSKEQTEQMQSYAVKAYEALQLSGYGRMDFMMDEQGRMYCLEANTLPGMTPTSLLPQEAAAVGIAFPELCELLIEVSMKARGQKR